MGYSKVNDLTIVEWIYYWKIGEQREMDYSYRYVKDEVNQYIFNHFPCLFLLLLE